MFYYLLYSVFSFPRCFCTVVNRMTANVPQLGEVADLEALTFNLALMFIRNPNVQFSTEPAILPNCCYAFALYSVSQFSASCVIPLYQSTSLSVEFANSFDRSKNLCTCLGSGT